MKRYDALLDEDPAGGWVNYEEYVQEKIELESNNILLTNENEELKSNVSALNSKVNILYSQYLSNM